MSRVVQYLRQRPWLLGFFGIVGLGVLVLALFGQIRLQGDGHVTVYEWGCVGATALIWLVAKFLLHRDLSEEYVMGWIFGIQWEFLTEPYWTYLPDKFNVVMWAGKDMPLLALVGWGATFALALSLSSWLGKRLLGLSERQLTFDGRVLLIDAVAIQVVGGGAEWLLGIYLHCWDYALPFGIGTSPLGLGWEIHLGYTFVMFWYATTFRVWKLKLEGQL